MKFRKWSFRYPDASDDAVRDVAADWLGGEFVLVRGDVGSGKSTLLAALPGLVPLSSGGVVGGELAVCGLRPERAGLGALSRVVAYVPQAVEGFAVAATVEAELAFSLEMRGVAPSEIGARVANAAKDFGIAGLLNRRHEALSGGERQLVSLAAATLRDAPVLVADEPLVNLDLAHAAAARAVFEKLVAGGKLVVVSEHRDLGGLGGRARVVALDGGRVVEAATLKREVAAGAPSFPAAGSALVSCEGVSVELGGVKVLSRVDFQLAEGECVALVGANGSGKTTLLRALAGLARPASGSVRSQLSLGRELGFLPQRASALFVRETVADELALCSAKAGGAERVGEWPLSALRDLLHRHPLDLSAGQRQLLGLAIADCASPRALLLDEPTRGLSAPMAQELSEWVRRRVRAGVGVVVATHDLEFARRVASRVVRLEHGEAVSLGALTSSETGGHVKI